MAKGIGNGAAAAVDDPKDRGDADAEGISIRSAELIVSAIGKAVPK
jgi:hypothetical protein